MKTLLKPERLSFGDTIGIVAPASPPPDPKAVDGAIEALERHGFKAKLGKHVRERQGFLAGNDRDRAADIMEMFADKNVKAVMCLRGGYGSARLLGRLDYEVIRQNAKIFAGFSDITSLHCVIVVEYAGMISIHAPMLSGGLLSKDALEFTRASFFRTVMEATPVRAASPRASKNEYFNCAAAWSRSQCDRWKFISFMRHCNRHALRTFVQGQDFILRRHHRKAVSTGSNADASFERFHFITSRFGVGVERQSGLRRPE